MDYIAPFLLGIAILLVFLVRNQRQLQEKRQKIVVKEHRMFSFLHGLGEALQTSRTREELHQFILKGAMEVVEGRRAGGAHGGGGGGAALGRWPGAVARRLRDAEFCRQGPSAVRRL